MRQFAGGRGSIPRLGDFLLPVQTAVDFELVLFLRGGVCGSTFWRMRSVHRRADSFEYEVVLSDSFCDEH